MKKVITHQIIAGNDPIETGKTIEAFVNVRIQEGYELVGTATQTSNDIQIIHLIFVGKYY